MLLALAPRVHASARDCEIGQKSCDDSPPLYVHLPPFPLQLQLVRASERARAVSLLEMRAQTMRTQTMLAGRQTTGGFEVGKE